MRFFVNSRRLVTTISHARPRLLPTATFTRPFDQHQQIRTYKKKKSFPLMTAVSIEDVTKRMGGMRVRDVVEHSGVKNGAEWREALGGKEVVYTKTVSCGDRVGN